MKTLRHAKRFFAILLAVCAVKGTGAQTVLTNPGAIRALPREEAAQRLRVKMQGVVTFAYQNKDGNFVIYDSGKSVFVNISRAKDLGIVQTNSGWRRFWTRGMLLAVEGVTDPGGFASVILPERIQIIGTAALPTNAEVTVAQLLTGTFDCQQVALQGVVQQVEFINDTNQGYRVQLLAGHRRRRAFHCGSN